MSQFIENTREKHRIQATLDQELKRIVIEYLKPKSGQTIRYWDLHDTLSKQLEIPKELESDFRVHYERVIQRMDFDKLLLKSWTSSMGGYIVYPYELGMQSLLNHAHAVDAIHRLSMQVQYGDEIKP